MANLVIKQLTTLGNLVSLVGFVMICLRIVEKNCRNTVENYCITVAFPIRIAIKHALHYFWRKKPKH